jgi:outer membrane biosynthesis protein TonB
MSTARAGRFVLENANGEVVRTFSIEADELVLVYRHDIRRVDVVSDVEELDEAGISYDVLKRTSADKIEKRGITLDNGATFAFRSEIGKTVQFIQILEDSKEQEKAIYKYTAYTQLGITLFVMIVGLIIEPWLQPKPEEAIVTVVPQEFIPKPKNVTVKAAEKVIPKAKVAVKEVKSRVKTVSKVLTAKIKTPRKQNAPVRTKVNVENVGALGALGGMKTGSKSSSGFNPNALNDSRGSSWTGAGSGGIGGMERAIHGKGLTVSAVGQGQKVEGGGGYSTRGKAGGGRAGYGTMNMGGAAQGYYEQVSEEAVVEGGLDKDQIAAVINRHIGEVIYCYEKGLQVKSGLSGRVGVDFTINGGGIVSTAKVAQSSLNSAQVEGCITSHLRGWKFPKPVGGVNVKVSYPFVLKRVNG